MNIRAVTAITVMNNLHLITFDYLAAKNSWVLDWRRFSATDPVAVVCIALNYWGTSERWYFGASSKRKATSSNRAPSLSWHCCYRLHYYYIGRMNYDLSFVVTTITVTCYSWAPSSVLTSTMQSEIMFYTSTLNSQHWSIDLNRGAAASRSLSVMFNIALLVCDAIIVSTISRMMHAVAAVIIILYSRWWFWARLCCAWKLPNLF